jgi:hypothetical protein
MRHLPTPLRIGALSLSCLFTTPKGVAMKLGTEYTSLSSPFMPSATFTDRSLSANGPPAQVTIFPESGAPQSFATTPHDEAVAPPTRATPHPRSQAGERTANAGRRDKRGGVLGSCSKSEFRECRGGEALKQGTSIYFRFDQSRHKETRGEDGRGMCEGIVREVMRRIDRTYNERPRLTASSAVITMRDDMRTPATARESGIYDNIATFQDNRHALALRNYAQSRDMMFGANDTLSREDHLHALTTALNAMPPGGFALVGVRIQTAGAASPGDSGHALLIQRRLDQPAPDGSPPKQRYIIFDPNNGAFEYPTPGSMNTALQNYLDTAYSDMGAVVTPDRAIFYDPRIQDGRQWKAFSTVAPPSFELREPPGFMQEQRVLYWEHARNRSFGSVAAARLSKTVRRHT